MFTNSKNDKTPNVRHRAFIHAVKSNQAPSELIDEALIRETIATAANTPKTT